MKNLLEGLSRWSLERRCGRHLDPSLPFGVVKLLKRIKNSVTLRVVSENLDSILAAYTRLVVIETCNSVEGGSTPVGGGTYGWCPVIPKESTTLRRIDVGRKGRQPRTLEQLGYSSHIESDESGDPYGEYFTYTRSYSYDLKEEVDVPGMASFLRSLAPDNLDIRMLELQTVEVQSATGQGAEQKAALDAQKDARQ